MDESDYKRVCKIIGYVLCQPMLTEQDREDIRQEAAIAAWKYGLEPSTRIYWAALDAARRIRKKRILDTIDFDVRDDQNIEEHIVTMHLLNQLTELEKLSLSGTLQGYSQQEIADSMRVNNSTISRHRTSAMKKLKNICEQSPH